MTTDNHWARFAPSLAHLLPQLEEFEPVLAGYTSGPQPQSTLYDPAEPESLSILTDNPWGEEEWITIHADGCSWTDEWGETYQLTHAALWQYLRQLPKPLHTFCN